MYVVKTKATYVAKTKALINCVFIVQLIFAFFRICNDMFSVDAALIISSSFGTKVNVTILNYALQRCLSISNAAGYTGSEQKCFISIVTWVIQ